MDKCVLATPDRKPPPRTHALRPRDIDQSPVHSRGFHVKQVLRSGSAPFTVNQVI
jgi:hypothetical protein